MIPNRNKGPIASLTAAVMAAVALLAGATPAAHAAPPSNPAHTHRLVETTSQTPFSDRMHPELQQATRAWCAADEDEHLRWLRDHYNPATTTVTTTGCYTTGTHLVRTDSVWATTPNVFDHLVR